MRGLFLLAMWLDAGGQAASFPVRSGIEFSPRWLDNLMFLNNMDKPLPPEKQVLYKWAETRLACNTKDGFSELSEFKPFTDHCRASNIIHLGGPMLGNITSSSADIWVRTVKPEKVTVKITGFEGGLNFGPVESTRESDLSAIVHVSGLKPDTQYSYQVFVGGIEIKVPGGASIHTTANSNDVLTRIAFGSCFHRWGLGNVNQSKAIVGRKPHALVLLGDVAVQDKTNSRGWHTLDYLARDLYPAWQNLVSNIPVYAIWDDHDYFKDDGWGIPPGFTAQDRENVWKVFRFSWNNPGYGFGDMDKGVFFRTRIGPCDVIMVDHRYFRTKESFLGIEQMKWFEEQLISCKGPFIILGCGSMWSDYVSEGKDSWGVFDPDAREKIFSLIEKNNISGVLLISGDRHGARGFRIPRPYGFSFYEFEAASLGGLSGPPATQPEWTNQFYGISGKFAFGEFSFDTTVSDPLVTFRLIGENSEIIHETTLKRSQLTPANFRSGSKKDRNRK